MNKVMLITGGAKRIGAHCAHFFHGQGYNIALHYRGSQHEADVIFGSLNNLRKNSCILLQADFTHSTVDYEKLINKTEAAWGRLDVLFNNASSFYPTPISEIQSSDWDELMSSNLKAPLFLSKYAAPLLKKTNGCIINMIDINTKKQLPLHNVYLSAKAGLENLTLSLAKELAPEIRVNGIAPGNILWPDNTGKDINLDALKNIPLQRQGSPQDIAKTALFLIENADYITGQIISVDGGKLLS